MSLDSYIHLSAHNHSPLLKPWRDIIDVLFSVMAPKLHLGVFECFEILRTSDARPSPHKTDAMVSCS